MRFTKTTLEKLQKVIESQGYEVRYEKGSFKGGYCIVHNQKTIIVNKFFPIEGMIQSLIEVVKGLEITDREAISDELFKFAEKIKMGITEEEIN